MHNIAQVLAVGERLTFSTVCIGAVPGQLTADMGKRKQNKNRGKKGERTLSTSDIGKVRDAEWHDGIELLTNLIPDLLLTVFNCLASALLSAVLLHGHTLVSCTSVIDLFGSPC